MSKKIRKKDLLARLEAVEKWQKEHDKKEIENLMAEIKVLETVAKPLPIDFSNAQNAAVIARR